jgi:hypothetical protein
MVSKSAPKGPAVYIVDPLVKWNKALWGSCSSSNPVWQLHIQVIVTCKFTTDLAEVVFMSLCCPQGQKFALLVQTNLYDCSWCSFHS